jgi:hypothetical protein
MLGEPVGKNGPLPVTTRKAPRRCEGKGLGEQDLEAVANYSLSGGDAKSIRLLVAYAQSSEKYLQGIALLARRARFLASKAGRERPRFQDVAAALKEGVVPSQHRTRGRQVRRSQ